MKNANEMREITNEVLAQRAEAREAKNQAYVEEEVAPLLEAMANKGYSSAEISISAFIDAERVKEILVENGYTIGGSKTYGCIVVKW